MHPMGQPPMQQPQVHAPFMQPVAPSMGGQMPLQPPQQAGPVLQEQALEMVEGLYKFESGVSHVHVVLLKTVTHRMVSAASMCCVVCLCYLSIFYML